MAKSQINFGELGGGGGVQMKSGTFTVSANGTYTVSDIPFEPTAIFFASGTSSTNYSTAQGYYNSTLFGNTIYVAGTSQTVGGSGAVLQSITSNGFVYKNGSSATRYIVYTAIKE